MQADMITTQTTFIQWCCSLCTVKQIQLYMLEEEGCREERVSREERHEPAVLTFGPQSLSQCHSLPNWV